MYIGGGAVDYEQSYLLGGLVVVCKTWTWAALVYAAARVVGLASSNSLGPLNSALEISMDGEEGEALEAIRNRFNERCQSVWQRTRECTTPHLNDPGRVMRLQKNERSIQCEHIGLVLGDLRSQNEVPVRALLGKSG